MIIQKNIGRMNTFYQTAFDYIIHEIIPKNRNYRVLDIGSGANPWAKEYITHVVDFFVEPRDKNNFSDSNIKIYEFDIEDSWNWKDVFDDVEKNGKFDFVICTHTLEDINNPEIICKIINKIGKAGFISMPSKYAEFIIFEYKNNLPFIGFHHHRWIYNIKNNKLIGTPKMTFHQFFQFDVSKELSIFSEISFLWENEFEFEFIKPDQLLDNRKGMNKINDLFEDDDLKF